MDRSLQDVRDATDSRGLTTNAPSPDIRSTFMSKVGLHVMSNLKVLHTMVSPHTTWAAVDIDGLFEEPQDCFGTVVVVGPNSSDEA